MDAGNFSVTTSPLFRNHLTTTEGTIRILERLHEYVPRQENLLFPLICNGDGLSCERHTDAHMARANAGTPLEGLQGLQPVAQEFHKRMLLMQVEKYPFSKKYYIFQLFIIMIYM